MRRVLTIAGSDCSGGAGIQADLLAFAENGVKGAAVISCITAQNVFEVKEIFPLPSSVLQTQIDAVFEGCEVLAVKVGMLYSAELIEMVSERLLKWRPPYVVVDPVMVASSGALLLEASAAEALKRHLLPMATLLTPNLHEARALLQENFSGFENGAKKLLQMGPRAVLIKGGHHEAKKGWDCFFAAGGEPYWLKQETKPLADSHGTGCRLSSAITAYLARGFSLKDAVFHGKSYVHKFIWG